MLKIYVMNDVCIQLMLFIVYTCHHVAVMYSMGTNSHKIPPLCVIWVRSCGLLEESHLFQFLIVFLTKFGNVLINLKVPYSHLHLLSILGQCEAGF